MIPLFQQGAFTANANDTPETIAQKRAFIAAMMPRFGSAKYVGEGLGQLATGVVIGRQNRKLNEAEGAGRKSAAELFERLMSGAGTSPTYSTSGGGTPSGTWTPDAPPPSPVDIATIGFDVAKNGGLSFGADMPKADPGVFGAQGGLDFGAATMTPQEMLIAGAKARGLDPIDVATAISYETGGRFDPMISGPTTQWGTHRGLIQFGEPQARQHGVDFSSPDAAWRSQLNPTSGAVWDYLDSTGVKPGMGLPEIYSAINAGAVGRMGASDANNGGAPGTVADKVASMGPHREKAAQFLGGTWTPDANYQGGGGVTMSTQGGGGIPVSDLMAAMANPWLDPQQRSILMGMYEQQQQQNDPMYQMQMRKAELELAQLENPTQQAPEEFTTRMFMLNALEIDPQSEQGQAYLLTGKLPEATGSDVPAAFAALDMQAQAAGLVPGTPEYQAFMRNGGGAGTPAAFTALDLQAKAAGFEPGTPEYQEFMATRGAGLAAEATTRGKAQAEAELAAPADISAAETTLSYITSLRDHPGRQAGSGASSWIGGIPGTDAREFQLEVERLKAGAFLTAIDQLKGMGALSNAEGQTATAAIAALDPNGTEEGFLKRLAEYEEIVNRGLERARKRVKAPESNAATSGKRTLKWNPATESFE